MLTSSLAGRGKELRDGVTFQFAKAESVGTEMIRAQNCTIELERQLVELGNREQKATEELKKMKEERDATVAWLAKLEVAELKRNEALAKKSSIEKFKSLDDFQEAVEFTASKYFG